MHSAKTFDPNIKSNLIYKVAVIPRASIPLGLEKSAMIRAVALRSSPSYFPLLHIITCLLCTIYHLTGAPFHTMNCAVALSRQSRERHIAIIVGRRQRYARRSFLKPVSTYESTSARHYHPSLRRNPHGMNRQRPFYLIYLVPGEEENGRAVPEARVNLARVRTSNSRVV